MILISHRGNIDGRIEERENSLDYITHAINAGFSVEIDLWEVNGFLYLGHDDPTYRISVDFLDEYNEFLWIHCKNINAFSKLFEYNKHRFFFHEHEKFVLTNKGDTIVHAQANRFPKNSVYMMPEILNIDIKYLKDCKGICSDYIAKYI